MPGAGRQMWKKWSSKGVELIPLENRNEQEQNKIVEKGTKKNGESKKNDEKEKEKEMNEGTMIKIILGQITLKHNLGLSIISFEIMNLGPYYVPKSPFWLNMNT